MTPDQPISLVIAILGGLIALILPRRYAIVPLAMSMCLYPSTLLVPPANLSLTPQRIIAGLLLLRCVLQPSIRGGFHWRLVDTAALVYFVLITISQLLTTPSEVALNNRAGFFLSALVPFWCVRFLIVDKPSLWILLKTWLWCAIPLAILGVYQMLTGDSPYFRIMPYGVVWKGLFNNWWDQRLLFGMARFRASAPFLQFIMYGWYFAILVIPATILYFEKRRLLPWIIPWLALPVGITVCIASGPMGFAIASIGLAALFPLRRFWKVGYSAAGVLYLFILVTANRSPMEFLAQLGKDESSSWYRVALVNYTLSGGGMVNHWLAGYGDIPPEYIKYHDLCIHWVWILVIHGIMGFVGFYGLIAASAGPLWKAKSLASSIEDQYLLWSLKSTLLASLLGMLSTALYSEMYFIYHMFLAMLANAPLLVSPALRRVTLHAHHEGQPITLHFALTPTQSLAIVPLSPPNETIPSTEPSPSCPPGNPTS